MYLEEDMEYWLCWKCEPTLPASAGLHHCPELNTTFWPELIQKNGPFCKHTKNIKLEIKWPILFWSVVGERLTPGMQTRCSLDESECLRRWKKFRRLLKPNQRSFKTLNQPIFILTLITKNSETHLSLISNDSQLVSISSTFFACIFCTKVLFPSYILATKSTFLQKNSSEKYLWNWL